MSEGWFTILGVFVGAILTWLINLFHRNTQRHERGRYCALRSVIALDAYVAETASHLAPDDYEQDFGPLESFQNPRPIALPNDVDWSSIDPSAAYQVLSIPNRHDRAVDSVGYIQYVADSWQARDVRDQLFAWLALDCAALSKSLRKRYALPAVVHSDLNKDWNPENVLRELLQSNEGNS